MRSAIVVDESAVVLIVAIRQIIIEIIEVVLALVDGRGMTM